MYSYSINTEALYEELVNEVQEYLDALQEKMEEATELLHVCLEAEHAGDLSECSADLENLDEAMDAISSILFELQFSQTNDGWDVIQTLPIVVEARELQATFASLPAFV